MPIDDLLRDLDGRLEAADAELTARFPGDRGVRQPVHTVYVPADRYDEHTVTEFGRQAVALLDEHGAELQLADEVRDRVRAKLESEPIEDLRIDFEDGYGNRTDAEEDETVRAAAASLRRSLQAGTASPYHGIRFKSFEAPTRDRGVRTLDLFVGELADSIGAGFVVTLPKVTSVDQVDAMVVACRWIEQARGLTEGTLRFEIQVETPQSILGPDGTALVARMVHAAAGRCTGLHYGTYDYSASCGIAAEYQSMEHPAADHAKAIMQVAAAGTGVFVSDGSTNVLPVGDRERIVVAWRLHQRLVRRSLERGYYQGWDLHPGQLPTRFAATYAFYREGFPTAAARLRAFVHGGDSGYLDEPATAVALAGFVVRALECGAVDEVEVENLIDLDRGRLAALARRKAGPE